MLRSLVGILAAFGLSAVLHGCTPPASPRVHRIALIYPPAPSVEPILEGFRAGIKTEARPKSYELREYMISSAEPYRISAITAYSQDPVVLAPVGTAFSCWALQRGPKVPLVFLAVTDPAGAGIVDSIGTPKRCTGVSDSAPLGETLRLIRTVLPSAQTVGILYNPDEPLATRKKDEMEGIARELGLLIAAHPVHSLQEASSTVPRLAHIDAMLLSWELTTLDPDSFLDQPWEKPVFATDSALIRAGAVAGYVADYQEIGREGARLVARVIRGEAAGSIPVALPPGILEINDRAASKHGILFPPEMLMKARRIAPL